MSKKNEEQNRETENEKTDQIETNEEEEFDPEAYFDSLASGEPDEEEEPEPDPEPEPEKDEESAEGEGDEEENPPVADEGPSEEDKEKGRQAVEAIGNKNYIDHELINSIEDKELRQKVWNLANTTQSHYNRLYQREQELGRMRGEVDRLRKEAEEARKPRTDAEKEKQDKEIERLKRDYPDLAGSIDAHARSIFDEKSQQLRELFDQEYGQMRQQYQEESRQRETQRLEEATNDLFDTARTGVSYRDVVASPDFAAWLETQPASVQQTARESDSAEELIPVFKTFDYDYSREYRKQFGRDWREDVAANRNQAEETQPSANSQATPVTSDGSDGPNEADEIAAKRDKKKRTSVTGVSPSRSAARSDVSLDDPEALFDHYVKQSARTRKR